MPISRQVVPSAPAALRRLRRHERGFTLIEVVMVLVILGILLAIAVVTYVGFKERAANNAARSNLRAAVPAAEAYFSSNGTYVGMSAAALQAIDGGLSSTLKVTAAAAGAYTLCDDPSGRAWQLVGPGGSSGGFTAIGSC